MTGRHRSRWLTCLLLLAPHRALAQQVSDAGVTLDWQAPSGCPNGNAVLAKVRALVSAAPAERVTARGIVAAPTAGGPWHLTLETVQGARTWQRKLDAATCDELADAGALIVALVLDPNLQVDEGSKSAASSGEAPSTTPLDTRPATLPNPPTRSAEQRPAPASPPPVVMEQPTRAPATTGASSALGGHVAASAVADWGSMPGIALGGELGVGAAIEPIELELSGLIFPRMREVIAQDRERGGEITLVAGALRGCYVLARTKLSGRLCAGFEAGRIQGTGFGTTGWTDEQNSPWIAGRLGVFGRYPLLPPLALRFGLEGLVPAIRPEFVLENAESVETVHQPNPAVLRLALGFELLFR